jgi:two-component system, response regulator YesN
MINILVVDDEINIREGIKNNIPWEEYGINVSGTAENAMNALELIIFSTPDIIIMDINMPEMSGLELLEIINNRYPSIKVILISGYRDFEYAQKAVNLNAFALISKPINIEQLVSTVLKAKEIIDLQIEKLKKDDFISKRVTENLTILKDNFFLKLINGKLNSMEESVLIANSLGLRLEGPQYLIAIIQTDNNSSSENSDKYDESLHKAIIMTKIENALQMDYNCYLFNIESNVGMLISGKGISKEILIQRLNEVKKWTSIEAGFVITISIGIIAIGLDKINLSYKTALSSLDYKLVVGNNQIIDSDFINKGLVEEDTSINFLEYLQNIEESIILALKSDNRKEIENIINNIVDTMHKIIENNINKKSYVVFTLAFYLYRILIYIDIYGSNIPLEGNDIYMSLLRFSTIKEVKDYLSKYFGEIINDIEKSKRNQSGFLANKALEYINTNIYSYISLVSAAEYLNIHPNYLSKIFKNAVGESFTDYVIKAKMNEAKKILKTSSCKVYEVAETLKYNDTGYFIKLFKKVFGISPNEYRQLQVFNANNSTQ